MENKRKSVVIWLTIVTIVSFFLSSCHTKTNADLLVFNGTIYTVDSSFSIAEAIVVNNRKIIFVGKKEDAIKKFVCTDSLNLNGKYVYPAFIDAHGHFYGFGLELNKVNLINCKSWDEAIQTVAKKFADAINTYGPDSVAFYVSGQILTEDYYIFYITFSILHKTKN